MAAALCSNIGSSARALLFRKQPSDCLRFPLDSQMTDSTMTIRTFTYFVNLRRLVVAVGCERDIVARVPEGSVKISSSAEIGEPG